MAVSEWCTKTVTLRSPKFERVLTCLLPLDHGGDCLVNELAFGDKYTTRREA